MRDKKEKKKKTKRYSNIIACPWIIISEADCCCCNSFFFYCFGNSRHNRHVKPRVLFLNNCIANQHCHEFILLAHTHTHANPLDMQLTTIVARFFNIFFFHGKRNNISPHFSWIGLARTLHIWLEPVCMRRRTSANREKKTYMCTQRSTIEKRLKYGLCEWKCGRMNASLLLWCRNKQAMHLIIIIIRYYVCMYRIMWKP